LFIFSAVNKVSRYILYSADFWFIPLSLSPLPQRSRHPSQRRHAPIWFVTNNNNNKGLNSNKVASVMIQIILVSFAQFLTVVDVYIMILNAY